MNWNIGLDKQMLDTIAIETPKYILVACGVLGFHFKKSKWNILAVIYCIIGLLGLYNPLMETIFYRTMWCVVFILSCLDGKILKRIQCSILAQVIIDFVDAFIIGDTYCYLLKIPFDNKPLIHSVIIDSIGIIFWLMVVVAVRKYRKTIRECFDSISLGAYFLIVGIILEISVLRTLLHFDDEGEFHGIVIKAFIADTVIMMISFFLLTFIILKTFYMKRYLEKVNSSNTIIISKQQKYYEDVIRKDEKMKAFRHDVQKHLRTINMLCEDGNVEKIKEYTGELVDEYQRNIYQYTGNKIADYFVNDIVNQYGNDELKYSIHGRFPDEIGVSQSDFCVLIGNLFENVKEALEKVEGERTLNIIIRNFNGHIIINVENSSIPKDSEHTDTDKADTDSHGYGIRNMRNVVEKNGGEITFSQNNGVFRTEIII